MRKQKANEYLRFAIGDYLQRTMLLSTEEHGALLLLYFKYWVSGPLPADDVTLAKLVGASKFRWKNLKEAVLPYFEVRDGFLRHTSLDEERERAKKSADTYTMRAQKGARGRWRPPSSSAPDRPFAEPSPARVAPSRSGGRSTKK